MVKSHARALRGCCPCCGSDDIRYCQSDKWRCSECGDVFDKPVYPQKCLSDAETLDDEFVDFLKKSENACIRLDGYHSGKDEYVCQVISGLHRWKSEYKRRLYAKLQQLNPWYCAHRSPVTMATFTTRQRGLSIREQIDMLKHAFNKAKKLLNKYLGKFSYFWIMEPHHTGYAHIHMLIFRSVPRDLRFKLADAWCKSVGDGKYKDSLKFSMGKTHRSLKSAGAYVFKYVAKTLDYDMLANRDSGYFRLSAWVWKMSRHDTAYTGVRFWGCSRDLTEAMSYSGDVNTDTIWWRVSWRLPDGGWFPVWVDEDMSEPDADGEPFRVRAFDDWLRSTGFSGDVPKSGVGSCTHLYSAP